jgi:O-antigen/teichoic acid export membrane protein
VKPPFVGLDRHTAEVVRGAAVALFLRILGAALTFAFTLVVARMFGASGSGMFFLAMTVMTIATVFGRMGMDNALVKFIAGYASAGDWARVHAVHRVALRVAILASLGMTLILFVSAPWLAGLVFSEPALTPLLRWISLAVLPLVLATLYGQMLRGLKRTWSSMLVAAVWIPGLATIGVALLGTSRGPISAVWAYLIAVTATALGSWLWWGRVTPSAEPSLEDGDFDRRTMLSTSVPLLWVASMSMAMNWIGTFALGTWGTTADVGLFSAASRVAFLVSFVLVAVDNISAPIFAELYKRGDRTALVRTARNTVRLMVLLAAPLLILILVGPRVIMGLFGPEFVAGARVLVILALGQAINVVAGSVGYLLMMSGHERQVRNSNIVAAVSCFILSLILVPPYGALGAAIAVSVSLLARNTYEILMVRRHLGFGLLLFTSNG